MADNRLAYGLCKKYGINTEGMSPKEAWQALKMKGVTPESVQRTYENNKKQAAEDLVGKPEASKEEINKTIEEDSNKPVKDSKGNALSPSQSVFFKNTQIKEPNGNLSIMWHFTNANNDFNEFKSDAHGLIFVSPEPSFLFDMVDGLQSGLNSKLDESGELESASYNGEDVTNLFDGSLKEEAKVAGKKVTPYYINAKKPFKKFENDDEAEEFIKYLIENKTKYASDISEYEENNDVSFNEGDYDEDSLSDDFYDLIKNINGGFFEPRETSSFVDFLKTKNYDGLYVDENENATGNLAVFDSSQIKSIKNKNPTESKDIDK